MSAVPHPTGPRIAPVTCAHPCHGRIDGDPVTALTAGGSYGPRRDSEDGSPVMAPDRRETRPDRSHPFHRPTPPQPRTFPPLAVRISADKSAALIRWGSGIFVVENVSKPY